MRASRVVGAAAFMTLSYMKEPLAFVSDLIIPLVMFMVVQLGTGRGVESLLGILVAISWSSGSFALARKLATYSVWRLLDMFVASPLKPIEFAVASALAHLTSSSRPLWWSLAIMALTVGVSPVSLPFIAASILLAWFAGTAFRPLRVRQAGRPPEGLQRRQPPQPPPHPAPARDIPRLNPTARAPAGERARAHGGSQARGPAPGGGARGGPPAAIGRRCRGLHCALHSPGAEAEADGRVA
jgi:hypothetical protein